jgi:hypothetical protein
MVADRRPLGIRRMAERVPKKCSGRDLRLFGGSSSFPPMRLRGGGPKIPV